jgi:hypothetical protein
MRAPPALSMTRQLPATRPGSGIRFVAQTIRCVGLR